MIPEAFGNRAFAPPVPQTLEELGIPESLVTDLVLRRLLMDGYTTLAQLSDRLKLSLPIVDHIFRQLRQQHLIEVRGMIGNDYTFGLSSSGRELATERFQISHYAGPAPVSLRDYHLATRAQAARVRVNRKLLKAAFADLVLPDRLVDQLGPALISQTSLFLYGPSGNGKTSIAERLIRVYKDTIWIPYAVEVDNQIICVYDPVVHQRLEFTDPDVDPRWVLCRRPCILVGGELVPSMIELRLDEVSGIYSAPLQMKANNGIFIIDDFGRQLMSPRELLNRWIVPLDRRVDYLTLRYGVKFEIPFEVMVVFSTNLDPLQLADEAFLRRIQNKILVGEVDSTAFDEIFRRVITANELPASPEAVEQLRELCLRYSGHLRACYPGDICRIIRAIAEYEGVPPEVSRENLMRAAEIYFARPAHSPLPDDEWLPRAPQEIPG